MNWFDILKAKFKKPRNPKHRKNLTMFTGEKGPKAAPLPFGRMSGYTEGAKWVESDDPHEPSREYEKDSRDIKIGLDRYGRKIKTAPEYEVQDVPSTGGKRKDSIDTTPIIVRGENELLREIAGTIGHEWMHYLTEEEYNPMREEAAAQVSDMIQRGQFNRRTVEEAARDFAIINFWVEMVARLNSPKQMTTLLERTWNQYARKVTNWILRYTLEKITGKDMKPYLRDITETKIKEELRVWAEEDTEEEVPSEKWQKYYDQLIQIRGLILDVVPTKSAQLVRKYRAIYGNAGWSAQRPEGD